MNSHPLLFHPTGGCTLRNPPPLPGGSGDVGVEVPRVGVVCTTLLNWPNAVEYTFDYATDHDAPVELPVGAAQAGRKRQGGDPSKFGAGQSHGGLVGFRCSAGNPTTSIAPRQPGSAQRIKNNDPTTAHRAAASDACMRYPTPRPAGQAGERRFPAPSPHKYCTTTAHRHAPCIYPFRQSPS